MGVRAEKRPNIPHPPQTCQIAPMLFFGCFVIIVLLCLSLNPPLLFVYAPLLIYKMTFHEETGVITSSEELSCCFRFPSIILRSSVNSNAFIPLDLLLSFIFHIFMNDGHRISVFHVVKQD